MENLTKRRTFPAIRCSMGNWVYYMTYMSFSDINNWVKRTDEVHTNEQLSDMIQRELKQGRTVSEISDYLLEQEERFFNSIVIGVYDGVPKWYPIEISTKLTLDAPELDEDTRNSVGILVLDGNEKLFAIDGQHRVAGIKRTLERVKEDDSISSKSDDLIKDEVSVIFVAHRTDEAGITRTRRLFSTLNRNAKKVSRGEIIALDEDDAFAVTTRRLVEEAPLLSRGFVSFGKTAQLGKHNKQSLTSIIPLYDIVSTIYTPPETGLSEEEKKEITTLKNFRPSEKILEDIYQQQLRYWEILTYTFPEYQDLFQSQPDDGVANKYRHDEGGHLMFRPIGQKAFARAIKILMNRGMDMEDAVTVLSNAPMNLSEPPWRYVLWNPALRKINSKVSSLLPESILLCYAKEPPEIKSNRQYNLLTEYRKVVDDKSAEPPCPYIDEISFERNYTIDRLRGSLGNSVVLELFDELRSQVTGLDPYIQEIAHKYFGEYRLHDTFFSMTPRVNDIRIILNIKSEDINDPKNLVRVLPYRSGRGKGYVEVKINSFDQFEDVMALIIQSYEANKVA